MSTDIQVGRNEHGEPVITYTIVGAHDAMRWCFHMLHGQVEFGRDARVPLQRFRRWWGAKSFDEFDRVLTGNRMKAASIRPKREAW
jgi:hypothetical protein